MAHRVEQAPAGPGGSLQGRLLAVSVRQAVTPDRLLGGALGELLGLRAAVAVGAVGSLLTVPWVLARPLPGLRRMPAQPAPR